MDDGDSPEEILDTIGDTEARRVLAAIVDEPKSAKELTERWDLSQATVYRRVDKLQEYDLVEERTLVADDGNHYSEYRCNFDSMVISVEEDGYEVRILREDNLPDRFGQLWDDLAKND